MPTATSTEANPTHQVTLSDGTSTYGFVVCNARGIKDNTAIERRPAGRTSIKMQSGPTKYSDLEEPYHSISQDDWTGGRGSEDFGDDASRFYDSYRMNTWMPGRAILGPQVNYGIPSGTSYREGDQHMPGSVKWQSLLTTHRYLAYKFTTVSEYAADKAYLWIRAIGTPTGVLTVEICADGTAGDAGKPGAVKKTKTLAAASGTVESKWYAFDWTGTTTLTTATVYHIKVYGAAGDSATACWQVGVEAASGLTQKADDNSTWTTATTADLYFRSVDADDTWIAHYYEYKGQLYCVTAPDDATAPEIFYNGDRGATDSNNGALTTLVDGGKSWTTNEWAGWIAVITDGPGSDDELNWRVIVSNTSTALTVSPAWATEHSATTTDYAIVGGNKWTAFSGHGLTKPVTDVLISKDVIYYAQGTDTAHRRHREYNNGGTWTNNEWDDDGGSNKTKFFQLVEDPVDGQQVWSAVDDSSSEVVVRRADAVAWGTDLVFGTDIVIGNRYDRITGLESYGSPEVLWVMKEGSVWFVDNDVAEQIPLREMASVQNYKNGRAHMVHGVYLYFSMLHKLMRYFRNNLDDVGYDSDAGLPAGRQGPIYDLVGYPGFFYAAVDGGTAGTSSILASFGHSDFHEIYRAPETGQRIRKLHIQVIPGSNPDRLWFSQGTDLCWLPLPSDTLDPYRDSNYTFTHEGHLISAWHYASMQNVTKYWNSLTLFCENLTTSAQFVEADYQTDTDEDTDTWNAINGTFDTSPSEEVGFKSTNDLTGKRLRYRLRFYTNDNSKTPKLKATVVEGVGRIQPKFRYSWMFKAQDDNLDIEGDDDSYSTVQTLITQLDTWASATTPLTMRCVFSPYDNKTVMIEPASLRPITVIPDDQTEKQVGQLEVYEK